MIETRTVGHDTGRHTPAADGRHPVSGQSLVTRQPGISHDEIRFDRSALAGYCWQVCTITGAAPGPHLAILSGIHLSETASIEAAIRLQNAFDPETLCGTVSIIPLADVSGSTEATRNLCAIDGKNIGLNFPGSQDGSFSEALAHALLHDWAKEADCLVDLHGADLTEQMARTVTWQQTGDIVLDRKNRELAQCYDADFEMRLPQDFLDKPGRSCTARARMGQTAVYSVAGCNGLMMPEDVDFHIRGTLRVARNLSMIRKAPRKSKIEPRLVTHYSYLPAPKAGAWYFLVELGNWITKGDLLAERRNMFGQVDTIVTAPEDGWLIYYESYMFIPEGRLFCGIGHP